MGSITNKFKRLQISSILVVRKDRQRSELELDADGLGDSIRRNGVLNPIIVEEVPGEPEKFRLIAGERRLSLSAAIGLRDIPARLASELSALQLQTIELEENIRRRELPWRDNVKAIGKIHQLYLVEDPEWTLAKTSEAIGLKPSETSVIMRVFGDLESPAVAKATGLREAYNILSRKDERATADAMADIMETTLEVTSGEPVGPKAPKGLDEAEPLPEILPAEQSILQADFFSWAASYSGPKFNLLHCDFPYGVNVFNGPQSGANHETTYNDDPEIFWLLIKTLCENLDRLMAPSGHLMFWLSADIDIVCKTKSMFTQLAPSLEFWGKPLIWHKTDNMGIISDAQRGPRHVYELALVASREDRKIVKAKSDAYGAPTNKDFHPSTKPVPVLKHFMEMFVDEHTRLLDPTCGSGASIRAAESLGAQPKNVLGLELDPEHHSNALRALRQHRVLASASK